LRLVLSHHPRFRAAALEEATELLGTIEVLDNPDPAMTLVSGQITTTVDWAGSVFLQHVAPADVSTPLSGGRTDLELLVETWMARGAAISSPFSVQCRRGARSGGGGWATSTYSSRDVEVAVGSALQDEGAEADTDNPSQVVSVCLGESEAWSGLSAARDNIRQLGPLHRRYTSPWVVCRAERKLAEAIEFWNLSDSIRGARAVDLGASPGGWSWVLAEAGAEVIAVDPGALAAEVEGHPSVDHRRQRTEAVEIEAGSVDWLVNDMNIDPPDVLTALEVAHGWLKEGGRAVCTLKLASKTSARLMLSDFVSRLGPSFALESARHFYSNRQEVTLLIRRLPR